MMTLLMTGAPDLGAVATTARTYDKTTLVWQRPEPAVLGRTRAIVAAVVKAVRPGPPPAALVAQAKAAGFDLAIARDAAGSLWTLHEPKGVRAGAGLYAFRPEGDGPRICIQAPHTFFDQGTAEIALALFARLPVGCLMMNTIHRYTKAADGDRRGGPEHPADVAHAPDTWFGAATEALWDVAPYTIIQVHGFGASQNLPSEVAAIVSDGQATRPDQAPAVRLRAALQEHLHVGEIRLFGGDVDVLGATTNVQGKAARRVGATFLHIEMSADTRRRLGVDARPLAAAIRDVFGEPGRK